MRGGNPYSIAFRLPKANPTLYSRVSRHPQAQAEVVKRLHNLWKNRLNEDNFRDPTLLIAMGDDLDVDALLEEPLLKQQEVS